MHRFKFVGTIVLALMSISPAVLARVTPTTYFFYGRVNTASNDPNVPQPPASVPITIKVDTSFPADTYKNGVASYSGGSGNTTPSPILGASINHRSVHGLFDSIVITNIKGGMHKIDIASSSPMGVRFELSFTTTMAGVVHGIGIPKRIFPGNFQSASFLNSLFEGIQYSGQIID